MAAKKRDKKLNEELDALEKRIEQCRILYELYFSGIEKREPVWHRQEILRQITRLRRENIKSPIDRFRFRNIQARFNSLTQYWNRVNFQREQGTYYKDKRRLQMKQKLEKDMKNFLEETKSEDKLKTPKNEGEGAVPTYTLEDLEKPMLDSDSKGEALSEPKVEEKETEPSIGRDARDRAQREEKISSSGSVQKRGQGVGSSSKGGNIPVVGRSEEDRFKKIYKTYLKARQKCGESTNISYEALVKSLKKQIPKLKEKGYQNVDFKVVIKGGRAAILPVAKDKGKDSKN